MSLEKPKKKILQKFMDKIKGTKRVKLEHLKQKSDHSVKGTWVDEVGEQKLPKAEKKSQGIKAKIASLFKKKNKDKAPGLEFDDTGYKFTKMVQNEKAGSSKLSKGGRESSV